MAKSTRVVEVNACLVCPFNQMSRCVHPETLTTLQMNVTKSYKKKLTSLPKKGIALFCPLPTVATYCESNFNIDKEPE